MGKMIAVGPGGKAQAPERSDRCIGVIEAVVSGGMLDAKLLSPPMATQAEAGRMVRDMYLAGRYWCSCGSRNCHRKFPNVPHEANPDGGCPKNGMRVSVRADVVSVTDPATGHRKYAVQFRIFDKRESIRAVVQKYGPDPNQWPYYSRRKRLKAE